MAGQFKYVEQRVPLPYSQVPVSIISNIRQPAIPIFTKGEGDFNKEVNYAITPTGALFTKRRRFVGFGRAGNRRYTGSGGGLGALVTPEAAQTVSVLADLSTLIMLGTVLWFVFPILKNIRPRVASRFS